MQIKEQPTMVIQVKKRLTKNLFKERPIKTLVKVWSTIFNVKIDQREDNNSDVDWWTANGGLGWRKANRSPNWKTVKNVS